jgi:hypothetical protein
MQTITGTGDEFHAIIQSKIPKKKKGEMRIRQAKKQRTQLYNCLSFAFSLLEKDDEII